MQYKTTTRLFRGKYQYKLVLVCAGASWFRGKNWDTVVNNLKKVDLTAGAVKNVGYKRADFKTQEDIDYAFKLQVLLKKLTDVDVRVESPWLSIYSNTKANIDAVIKLDKSKIKYVCIPPDSHSLDSNTVIMPKMNYDYRVTMGKTTQEHSAFIAWAENNTKVKLTKSCKRDLTKTMSWGGSHFYITGENNLLLAKMHLGGSINKVERIVKA